MKKDEKLARKFVEANGWEHETGFAINTEEMNPEGWEEIYYSGATLEKALEGYFRATSWWSYKPANGEHIKEDIWEVVEEIEELGNSFEDFKKAMKK